MARRPPDTPERGDRCYMRKDKTITGTLTKYDPSNGWATVKWDNVGPDVCHLHELKKVI